MYPAEFQIHWIRISHLGVPVFRESPRRAPLSSCAGVGSGASTIRSRRRRRTRATLDGAIACWHTCGRRKAVQQLYIISQLASCTRPRLGVSQSFEISFRNLPVQVEIETVEIFLEICLSLRAPVVSRSVRGPGLGKFWPFGPFWQVLGAHITR